MALPVFTFVPSTPQNKSSARSINSQRSSKHASTRGRIMKKQKDIKRRNELNVDRETGISLATLKQQQQDRTQILRSPSSYEPVLVAVENMRKKGELVKWMMGEEERKGWAWEIRGMLTIEGVRMVGGLRRRRIRDIAIRGSSSREGGEGNVAETRIKETYGKKTVIKDAPIKDAPTKNTPSKNALIKVAPIKDPSAKNILIPFSPFKKTSKGDISATPYSSNSSQSSSTATVSQRLSERSSSISPPTSFSEAMDIPKRQVFPSLPKTQTLLQFPVKKSFVQTNPVKYQVGEKSHQIAVSIQKSFVPTNVVKHHNQISSRGLAASNAKKRPNADTTVENPREVKKAPIEQANAINSEKPHEFKEEQQSNVNEDIQISDGIFDELFFSSTGLGPFPEIQNDYGVFRGDTISGESIEKEDPEVKNVLLSVTETSSQDPAKKASEMPTLVPSHIDYWFKTMDAALMLKKEEL